MIGAVCCSVGYDFSDAASVSVSVQCFQIGVLREAATELSAVIAGDADVSLSQ